MALAPKPLALALFTRGISTGLGVLQLRLHVARNVERGGAASVDGKLEMLAAAKERADFAGPNVRRTWRRRRDGMAATLRATVAARERFERASIDVGDQISEPIDQEHDPGELFAGHRLRNLDLLIVGDRAAERESWIPFASHAAAGANRSRPSNVRLTVGRAYRRSVNSTIRFGGSHGDRRQHPVIRSDEPVIAGLDGDPFRGEPTPGSTTERKMVPAGK